MLSDGEDGHQIEGYDIITQMVRIGQDRQDWEPAEEESEVWAAFNLDQRPKLMNLQASL